MFESLRSRLLDRQPPARPERSGGTQHSRHFVAERDVPCPACGYNLRAVESDTCPECGSPLALRAVRASHQRDAQRVYVPYMSGLMFGAIAGAFAAVMAISAGVWELGALALLVAATLIGGVYRLLKAPERYAALPAGTRNLRTVGVWGLGVLFILAMLWTFVVAAM